MIGIEFQVRNGYNTLIAQILNSVDVFRFKWDIVTEDIFYPKDNKAGDSDPPDRSGHWFFKNLEHYENYYLIFLDLKAYPPNSNFTEVTTFEEFLESDCQLVLLCTDCTYMTVYSKDPEILNAVYENCKLFDFQSVEFISEEEATTKDMFAF